MLLEVLRGGRVLIDRGALVHQRLRIRQRRVDVACDLERRSVKLFHVREIQIGRMLQLGAQRRDKGPVIARHGTQIVL